MYKRYKPKRLLPKIIKSNGASQKLKNTLYEEEAFDFIKKNIIGATPYVPPTTKKERGGLEDFIREKYSTTDLFILKDKHLRKKERPKLTELQYQALCRMAGNINLKVSKKKATRQQRLSIARLEKRQRQLEKKKNRKHWKYDEYINSKAWRTRRNLYWRTHTKLCAVCNTAKHIHLHHMHYGKFGNEPDEHLVPLCEIHHDQYHKENGVKRDMIRLTTAFIETNRALMGREHYLI